MTTETREVRPVQQPMNVRAGLYLRQSIDHAEGIERQQARTTALASQRGWAVVDVYADDGQSATKDRGPKSAWAQMIQDAKRGHITHVLAVDLDRLLRSQRDLLTLVESGLAIVTVDGELDLSSADGEFRATMLAALARFEVKRKSERQKRANEYRAAQGRPVPGRRRYGYEADNMTPRAGEAAVVGYMFQSLVENESVRHIAQTLNREGKRPTTGSGLWTPRRVRDTLTNRSYVGEVSHRGTWTKSASLVPLVNADLFERVQRILADPTRKTSPGAEVRHLLSGLAVCGVCGSAMKFMRSYRCRLDASHPSINKDILERLVHQQVLAALLLGPSAILPAVSDEGDSLEALEAALGAVQRQREGMADLLAEGLIDAATARPRLTGLKDEERRLAARRDALLQSSVAVEVLAGIRADIFTDHHADLQRAVDARVALSERVSALSLHRHRELVQMLVHVTVNPGRSEDRVVIAHVAVDSLNENVA